MPPNQCSRPTELIPPRKAFFVATIFSRCDFTWNARVRARTTFQNQSATNQPSMPGIYRGDECPQFFIIFNTRVYSFPCSMRRTMASVIRSISDMRCARAACRKRKRCRYARGVISASISTSGISRSSFLSPFGINGDPLYYN